MNKKSFTLIELLVVIAIIGILSSLVIARFSNWNDNARIANTLQWSAGVHRTLSANLVRHWPLDGYLNDISGYGNHGLWEGTDTNAPSENWVDGVSGSDNQALEFNGIDDYVALLNKLPIGTRTISFWIKTTSTDRGVIFDEVNFSSASTGFSIDINNIVGQMRFMVAAGVGGEAVILTTTSNNINNGKWYHIVGSNDGTTNTDGVKLYINSILDKKGTNIHTQSGEVKYIGVIGQEVCKINYYEGIIDDVRIYDTALTAEEVSRIYAESKDSYLVHE